MAKRTGPDLVRTISGVVGKIETRAALARAQLKELDRRSHELRKRILKAAPKTKPARK